MRTPKRALSLHARQLIAASLGLIAFLGLTGIALDKAFQSSLINNMEERMARYASVYWNDIELDGKGRIIKEQMDSSPDARFENFRSGLYAQIEGRRTSWQSGSVALFSLPGLAAGEAGRPSVFNGPVTLRTGEDSTIKAYQYTATSEFSSPAGPVALTLRIYEDEQEILRQIVEFRKSLWIYLVVAGLLLVLVQIVILRWSLQPLRVLER